MRYVLVILFIAAFARLTLAQPMTKQRLSTLGDSLFVTSPPEDTSRLF